MTRTPHEEIVEQLDQFYNQAKRQILQNQSAITGLYPANSAEKTNASIKTSLWAASSIFSLYLAYSKRVDNDQGKAHDLGQSVVKCMRGILFAWMRQSEKVESFKANQSPKHALHVKFDLHSGLANDSDYPHLQIDVVSLYLIFLANFIASGLDIIYCMDEVTFIQNLVYYVERAYRTPDYGNWEPSSLKQQATTNDRDININNSYSTAHHPHHHHHHSSQHNSTTQQTHNQSHNHQHNSYSQSSEQPINYHRDHCSNPQPHACKFDGRSLEIRATSIGMAKSALEAINGCNLFGGKGANWSIIYSDIDAHSRNRSIFETLLPRESRSKNTDSYLLATISWPCFATHDPKLYQSTKGKILRKLKGKYGLKRFLRDPYGTVLGGAETQTSISAHEYTTSGDALNLSGPFEARRETSFASTRSNSATSSTSDAPTKTKQRKSSYHQRKNVVRGQSFQASDDNVGQLLQRIDKATKMSKRFEHIESEWPLYVCFLIIDGIFKQDMDQVYENERLLYERLLRIDPEHGDYLMPKYYYVPHELLTDERCHPDTVERLPSAEGSSKDHLYLTGQAILLITRLLLAGLVHPNELDLLRRHMPSHNRPKRIGRYSSFQAVSSDLVVQTVLIAESIRLQALMANFGIQTQTPLEVEPVQIWSSAQLVKVYEYLGVNEKLGLKGRPSRPVGALGTSKLYRICGQTILCYPLIFEVSDFYLAQDMLLLIDDIQNELNFIGRYWRMSGRPTVCILIREEHIKDVNFRDLLDLLVQFKNGKLKKSGLHIKTGRLQNLISSSCIEHLDFLHLLPHEHLPQFKSFRQLVESPKQSLLNMSRATSFSAMHPPKSRRAMTSSASAHNLHAIDELNGPGGATGATNESFYMAAERSVDPLEFNRKAFRSKKANHKMAPNHSETDTDDYSTIPSNSIDYYECYKDAPTWPTLIEILRTCSELSGHSQLLAILWEREGAKYCIDEVSVEDRLERVSHQACKARNWSVVRYCSAVLKRSVESLSPWLTSILVNGKQISLGMGANERIINNPLTPTEIHTLIYSTINTKNPCDVVLQQEIALYIGRLISTRSDCFEGILTIRVSNFMSAMRSYMNIKTNELKVNLQKCAAESAFVAAQLEQKQRQEAYVASDEGRRAAAARQHYAQSLSAPDHQLLDLRIKQEPAASTSTGAPVSVPAAAEAPPPMTVHHHPHHHHHHQQQHSYLNQQQQTMTSGSQRAVDEQSPINETTTLAQAASAQHQGGLQFRAQALHPPPTLNCVSTLSGHRERHRKYQGTHSPVARPLESLSPSEVRKLLVRVLTDDESLDISDWRQITGELCRVPKDFYDKVWALMSCTDVGIVIGGKILRSTQILAYMTQDDLNFALKVESLLNSIDCPKLRQINVESLMALHMIVERHPEIRFESEPLDIDKIINTSLDKFRADFASPELDLRDYYRQSVNTISLYTIRTVFDCILPAKFRGSAESKMS